MEYFKTEFDSIDGRVKRLAKLGKDVFWFSLKPDKRDAIKAVELNVDSTGFWVIYPPTSYAEYLSNISEIKVDVMILNRNGTSMLFSVPKIKKVTKKKKGK